MVTAEESYRISKPVQLPHHALQVISSEVHWIKLSASYTAKGFVAELQPIMCDFDVVKDEKESARFFITLILALENPRDTDKALSFELSTVTHFEYRPQAEATTLPEDEEKRWQLFRQAIEIAISTARGYLINYLAPTLYRNYILPVLDLDELVESRYAPPALPVVPSTAPSEKPPRKPYTRKPRE